ncbi:hypothetical protein AA637_04355 [Cyanobacterium sp. HL-69]|nr:hypothetical protein AA637_04355 [Cyanobacterium sp. HL-69]
MFYEKKINFCDEQVNLFFIILIQYFEGVIGFVWFGLFVII